MTWLPHHALRTLSHAVIDAQIALNIAATREAGSPHTTRGRADAFVRQTDRAMARLVLAACRASTVAALGELCFALAQHIRHIEGPPHDGPPSEASTDTAHHAWFELACAYQQACYLRWRHEGVRDAPGPPRCAMAPAP